MKNEKSGSLMAKQRRAGWYYLMPGTVLITVMSFIPIINGFLTSLKTGSSANMKWASPLTYNYTRSRMHCSCARWETPSCIWSWKFRSC